MFKKMLREVVWSHRYQHLMN